MIVIEESRKRHPFQLRLARRFELQLKQVASKNKHWKKKEITEIVAGRPIAPKFDLLVAILNDFLEAIVELFRM